MVDRINGAYLLRQRMLYYFFFLELEPKVFLALCSGLFREAERRQRKESQLWRVLLRFPPDAS